jgi:hypothetical protein
MKYFPTAALFIAGVIHLMPISGAAGVPTLAKLYGIEISDPNIVILLQHRSLLFGVLGAIMLFAIPIESLRITALFAGLVSATSFIGIAVWSGEYNHAIQRVVIADVIASALLAVALIVTFWFRRQAPT